MRGASSSSVPQWVCVTARPPLHAYRVCPDRIGIHTHARVHCKCLTVCVLARLHSILLLCANSEYHFALPSAFVCSFEDPPQIQTTARPQMLSLFVLSLYSPPLNINRLDTPSHAKEPNASSINDEHLSAFSPPLVSPSLHLSILSSRTIQLSLSKGFFSPFNPTTVQGKNL